MNYPQDWYCTECYQRISNSYTCTNCGFNPYASGVAQAPPKTAEKAVAYPRVQGTYTKKRPKVVWIFTLINAYFIYSEGSRAVSILFSLGDISQEFSILFIIISVVGLISEIPRIIMTFKFFMLKRNAIPWVHASYSLGIAFIASTYLAILYFGGILTALFLIMWGPTLLLGAGMTIFLWWAILDYIKKKKVDGQQLFI